MNRPQLSILRSLIPLVSVLLVASIIPAIYAIGSALLVRAADGNTSIGLANFIRVAKDSGLALSVRITVIWASVVTCTAMIAGFCLGFALHRSVVRSALYLALLIPWGVPAFVLIPLWRILLYGSGGSSPLALITGVSLNLFTDPLAGFFSAAVVSAWTLTPIVAFAVFATIRSTPASFAEAARIEGASESAYAVRILAPMAKHVLLALGLLTFFRSIKEFTVIHLLTDGGPPFAGGITATAMVGATSTVEVYLYARFSHVFDIGLLGALSTVPYTLIIPVAALWIIARTGSRGRCVRFEMLVAAIAQIMFAPAWGAPAAALYIASSIRPKWILVAFVVDIAINLVHVLITSFPRGINPGLFVSALAVIVYVARAPKRSDRCAAGGELLIGVFGPAKWLFSVGTICISAALLYLLVWISLSPIDLLFVDRLLPANPTLGNFGAIVDEPLLRRSFFNTIVLATSTAIMTMAVSFPAAVALSSISELKAGAALAAIQITAAVGGMHTLVPLYWIARHFSLVGNYLPIIVLYCAGALPVAMLVTTAVLRQMPKSFRETAMIEGCGSARFLATILLPMCRPVLTLTAVTAFVGAWNGFLAPLVFLYDSRTYPIGLSIYHLVGTIGSAAPRWGAFSAVSLVNLIIIAAVMSYLRFPLSTTDLSGYAPDG